MADIKTKDNAKGTIRTIDKAAVATQRMKQAYIATKEKAERSVNANSSSAEEYASDKLESGIDEVFHDGAYAFDKAGRKGLETTKENIRTAKDGIQRFKQQRAEQSLRKQASQNTSSAIKTVDKAEKTIKQSATSSGKKTIKFAGKEATKTAQKSVKTAEQTAKTAIKTSQQAAKAAQKTAQATVKASQKAAQAAKATAKATAATIKAAAKATIAAVKAIIAAVKGLIAAIAAGGWVAVVVIIVLCLVALIAGSVFGIFFSGEDSGTGMSMQTVVQEINQEYDDRLEQEKNSVSVYERYTDQVEPYGMDECWLDISGTESLFGSPEKVANEIRETMKFELGLTISVGVSFNKIFAKLGSDMKKPDAVTVIPKDTFREKIWGLPAADLLGVGRATQRVLDSYCIRTIGDLANNDPEFLRRRLGKNGVVLWNYANGNDLSLVAKKDFVSPIKSVGHGITTVADLEKPEQVWPVFLELTQDIGHKLRVHGLSAEGVAIHIRDNTLNTRQWQTKIALPTQSPMIIAKTAFQLFEKRYGWNNPIRSVTVQAINLIPQDTPRQIDMFMDAAKQDKLERMEKCVEEIRRRFGKDSIRNGVLCQNLRLPPEKAEITMPTGMVG